MFTRIFHQYCAVLFKSAHFFVLRLNKKRGDFFVESGSITNSDTNPKNGPQHSFVSAENYSACFLYQICILCLSMRN